MKVSEISVELMVSDVGSSISFYEKALGFKLLASEQDEDGAIYWAKMQLHDFLISFKEEKRLKEESEFMRDERVGGGIALCLVVEDLEQYYTLIAEKFKLLDHPHLTPCGATQFSLKDNNGYVITIERFS